MYQGREDNGPLAVAFRLPRSEFIWTRSPHYLLESTI